MNEIKHAKFKKLAVYRTNNILEKLRLLGNLSNKSNYDYSDDEIKIIFATIEKQLKSIKSKFTDEDSIKLEL